MKRTIVRVAIGLGSAVLLLVVGVLVFAYLVFNTGRFDDSAFRVELANLVYFQESYEECRAQFRQLSDGLAAVDPRVRLAAFAVPSATDHGLSVDCCYLPATGERRRLLILSSGVHGVEGFTGSAVQQMFIQEILPTVDRRELGILLIHGVNPFGFVHGRRGSERNVDLNRNAEVGRELFSLENPGYARLSELLNPAGKLNPGSPANRFFLLRALREVMKASLPVLRQAILQGQYQYPEGLYYGGQDFEPQWQALKPYIRSIAADYALSFCIDLHTGYGDRGALHLMVDPIDDPAIRKALEGLFAGYPLDWGDSEDFYMTYGSFDELPGKLVPGQAFLPMTFEYGTINSLSTVGSIKSLHTAIMENQGWFHGYRSDRARAEVTRRFREMYYPSSAGWRSEAMGKSRDILSKVVARYQELEI